MKKILLLLTAAAGFSLFSQAQITKGSVLLGGGISGGKSSAESSPQVNKYSSFSFYPAVGVAVKDNSVVGLRLSYSHSTTTQIATGYSNIQEQNGRSAALFYRRYMNLSRKFYLFGEGAVGYSYNKYENQYTNSKSTQTNKSFGVNVYPGVAFAVSRKIHLEVGLNNLVDLSYTRSTTENTSSTNVSTSKGSGFGFSTNVSSSAPLTVGFRFVLGK